MHLELLFYSQRPSYNSNLRPYRYEGSLFKRAVLTVTDCLSTVHSNVDAFYERWYMLAQLTEDSLSLATEWLPYYRPYIPRYIPMTPGRHIPRTHFGVKLEYTYNHSAMKVLNPLQTFESLPRVQYLHGGVVIRTSLAALG